MESKQVTKHQHTTPKCYLKNFSDDGNSIYQKFKVAHTGDESSRNRELRKPGSLKSATVIEDFYTLTSGNDPMLVETTIYANHIENEYSDIYKLLIDPAKEGFDMVQRMKLLSFFLTLHLRTPKQFEAFFRTVPNDFHHEMDKIREDYKAAHIKDGLPALLETHQFKVLRIVQLTGTSEFFTSDNPVLIVDKEGNLKNHDYKEQFNIDNLIVVPIDKKHCCIFSEVKDKNDVPARNRVFINRIERVDDDGKFATTVNFLMLESADKIYFGSENFMKAFFQAFKLTEI